MADLLLFTGVRREPGKPAPPKPGFGKLLLHPRMMDFDPAAKMTREAFDKGLQKLGLGPQAGRRKRRLKP